MILLFFATMKHPNMGTIIKQHINFLFALQHTSLTWLSKLTVPKPPPRVFCTGKHLCWSLFLKKILPERHKHRRFPLKFPKYFKTPILKTSCERLNRWLSMLTFNFAVFNWKVYYLNFKWHLSVLLFIWLPANNI